MATPVLCGAAVAHQVGAAPVNELLNGKPHMRS